LSNSQVGGATIVAMWPDSDFVLLRLNKPINEKYAVYFSGWDASGKLPTKVVCYHHPVGYGKATAIYEGKIKITDRDSSDEVCSGNFWKIDKWNVGFVEQYSSGSGLWDLETDSLIGQLYNSTIDCKGDDKGKSVNAGSWYGRFCSSWNGGGTRETQLKCWLDPCKTGATSLRGKNYKKPITAFSNKEINKKRCSYLKYKEVY